jgi:hypothetical protein
MKHYDQETIDGLSDKEFKDKYKKGLEDLKINQLLGLEVRYLKYLEDL